MDNLINLYIIYIISLVVPLLVFGAAMLLAFRAGYNAGKGHDHLIKEPNIDIPIEVDEEERTFTHDEIMEDMKATRTIMQGHDLE